MLEITEVQKWETEHTFLASVLQRECLNYQHYVSEIEECIEAEKNKEVKNETIHKN